MNAKSIVDPDLAPYAIRANFLFRQHLDAIYRRTDRIFAVLMLLQWIGGIVAVEFVSPRAWSGSDSSIHPHVIAAVLLGGAISGLAIYFALVHTGSVITRHVIAVCQMLTSALFIHYSGGRIETHFHVFGSLAFLAFYRDWRVLLTATVVVAGDHILRGTFWPQSVFGTETPDPWRWIEHAAWVVFEDIFLVLATFQSVREMYAIAFRQAKLEATELELTSARDGLDEQVRERTAELASTNESLMLEIAERERAEKKVLWQSYHDALTKIPNRIGFHERLIEVIDQASRKQQHAAIIFIDLDRFKQINDTFGHPAGDLVLCEASARIKDCLRAEDILARFGGDEFAALLPGLDEQAAIKVGHAILETLSRPMHIDGAEVSVSASLGISLYPNDSDDAATLVKYADTAMYRAKGVGGGFLTVYAQDMTESSREKLLLEANLRHAVERSEMVLYYQPQISFETGDIVGVEALVRWRHPSLGLVPPTKFIPLAEETGLILPIGKWVLEEACRQARSWHEAGYNLRMSVNLSGRQFEQPDLAQMVKHIIETTGVPASVLDLELTESTVMARGDAAITVLQSLRDLGISLAVDDFGTGYSSMSYLRHFPLDILKIDRSFARGLESNEVDVAIVRAVIDLSHAIGLTVVAEGVETEGQHKVLRDLGCDVQQGYLFSPPVPASEMGVLLAKHRRPIRSYNVPERKAA